MSQTENPPRPGVKRAKSETGEMIRFLLILAVIFFLARTFIFAPFSIPSESMMPRLLVGDYLIVSKWNYGYSRASVPWSLPLIPGHILAELPERGDIVVFRAPAGKDEHIIKRVIGLPGDRIQVREGRLYINDKPVERQRIVDFVLPVTPNAACLGIPGGESFEETASDGKKRCRYPQYRETLPNGRSYNVIDLGASMGDDTPEYVVPVDRLFLMGDDRDNSADSRFAPSPRGGVGFVPTSDVVGRARFLFFSTDGSAKWLQPWTWLTATRWSRIGIGL